MYNIERAIKMLNDERDSVNWFGNTDILDLAIRALERQIPKKPDLDESAERTLFKCSNCKRIRVTKWEDSLRRWEDSSRSGIETEFCPHCGQRFDWVMNITSNIRTREGL